MVRVATRRIERRGQILQMAEEMATYNSDPPVLMLSEFDLPNDMLAECGYARLQFVSARLQPYGREVL